MRVDFRGLPAPRAARGPRAAQAASPPAPSKNPRRSRVFMWSSASPERLRGARLLRLLAPTQARGLGLESAEPQGDAMSESRGKGTSRREFLGAAAGTGVLLLRPERVWGTTV